MLGSLQDAEEIAQETLLTIREGRVSQLTRFAFPRLFPLFGLPSYLASGQGTP
jgi:hypothetical protein